MSPKVHPNYLLRQLKTIYMWTKTLFPVLRGYVPSVLKREGKSWKSLAHQMLTIPSDGPSEHYGHGSYTKPSPHQYPFLNLGWHCQEPVGPKQIGQCCSSFSCQKDRQVAKPNPLESGITVHNSPKHFTEGLMPAKSAQSWAQHWSFQRIHR